MKIRGNKLRKQTKARNTMSENRLGNTQSLQSLQEEVEVLKDEMLQKEEYIKQLHGQLTNERKRSEEATVRYSKSTHEYFTEIQNIKKDKGKHKFCKI